MLSISQSDRYINRAQSAPKMYLDGVARDLGHRRRSATGIARSGTAKTIMPFIVKGSESTFTPAPAGTHSAVCVDVIDLGMQDTQFGAKHRARFVWEIDEDRPDYGDRFLVFATMNVSLHESSSMGALLRRWRGKDFTPEEEKGFDIENVIGAPCLLTVEHNEGRDGNTYANVAAAVPLPKGMTKIEPSGSYVRQKDRDDNSKDVRSGNHTPAPAADRPAVQNAAATAPAPTRDAAAEFGADMGDGLPF